jgi:enoyl-CoA hydratase
MINLKLDGQTAYIDMIPSAGKFTLLDADTVKELIEVFREAESSQAKTVVLIGQGGCFAVGADLKELLTYSGFDAKWFSRLGNTLFGLIRSMPQIVIAEIDGYCMGGGMDFAAACDFRYATADSRFAHPGAKLGIITGFGGTQSVTRQMKAGYASRFFFSGNVFDTSFMKEAGFLNGVFTDRQTMHSASAELCNKINRKPANALSAFKSSLGMSAKMLV